MQGREFQVIVIGGGHAGAEAAWAAANLLGCEGGLEARPPKPAVALVTIDLTKTGVMSCNPAIGGLAKGQLVREIDAMGGLMGLAADATGIQFKVLNTSRGPAVHGPRAQCDKHAYAEEVQRLLASRPEIAVVQGTVERLLVERGRIRGVEIKAADGEVGVLSAPAVVLTTGTFMRGLMHTGERQTSGGRFGEAAATGISAALRELGFELGRLKTGTPPRLRKASLDWNGLPAALGDEEPVAFSDLSARADGGVASGNRSYGSDRSYRTYDRFPVLPQVECRETKTTAEVHELIRQNLHRAPMYSGQIQSVGPRYCPSIEDKVVRFAERESHTVFLEPESLRPPFDDWIYCNGISTSLPADVQDLIVRSMPGCERAEIYRYGYAVEYDMVRPHQILATGMTKSVEGLFLAGQINGTSGYEEAAAQGLVAGINAARLARGEGEFTLGRDQAYIGVLMDDLITRTPVEPYRMFTSRAEHRLLLRPDNAADRLTPVAERLGLLSSDSDGGLGRLRRGLFEQRRRDVAALHAAVDSIRLDEEPLAKVIRRPEFEIGDFERVLRKKGGLEAHSPGKGALFTVFADRKYSAYLDRQHAEIRRHAELEHKRLPHHVDYARFDALRPEARQALTRFRPATFGQAGRLEGVTPADLTLLAVLVKKSGRAEPPASAPEAVPVR
jgi:tRNA uridine 5-carboxymethylaminomethyl modification enzyme